MPPERDRIAILLHGPPGSGKTEVARALLTEPDLAPADLADLGYGWDPGGHRRAGGTGRYSDLRGRDKRTLILELICGEPLDEQEIRGATRNCFEWLRVLSDERRKLHVFGLWASVEEALRRTADSPRHCPQITRERHQLYQDNSPLVTFPESAGINEERIDTAGRPPAAVAALILEHLRGGS